MMVQRIVMMAVVMVLVALPGLPDRVEAKAVSPDFVELAKRLNPTVVNIRTAKVNQTPCQYRPQDAAPLFRQ